VLQSINRNSQQYC